LAPAIPRRWPRTRREGVRDAIKGIIEYDGLHYDGWLPAPRSDVEVAA
jgi:hypothetical protein